MQSHRVRSNEEAKEILAEYEFLDDGDSRLLRFAACLMGMSEKYGDNSYIERTLVKRFIEEHEIAELVAFITNSSKSGGGDDTQILSPLRDRKQADVKWLVERLYISRKPRFERAVYPYNGTDWHNPHRIAAILQMEGFPWFTWRDVSNAQEQRLSIG